MSIIFLAATKQLYERFSPPVCLSVRPSHLFHYVPIIVSSWNFIITNDRSDVLAERQGQGSKVKVTEVKIQLSRFRTVTPVWIHIWQWNHAWSLMLLRRGALLFFNVIRQIKFQGHMTKKIVDFDPNWAFPDCNSSLDSLMAMKWCTKLEA